MLTTVAQWHAERNAQTARDESPRVRQFGLRPIGAGQNGEQFPGEVWARQWFQPSAGPAWSGTVRAGFAGRRLHLGHVGLARSVAQQLAGGGRVLLFDATGGPSAVVEAFEHLLDSFGAGSATVALVEGGPRLRETERAALATLTLGKLQRVYGWDGHAPGSVLADVATMLGFFLHDAGAGGVADVAFVDVKQSPHSVALARAGRALGATVPTLLYRRLFPSLRQSTGRGSVKVPDSTLFLDDDADTARMKFLGALTGGQAQAEDQLARGGDPTRCPVFSTVEMLGSAEAARDTLVDCQSGALLCGECKARNVDGVIARLSDLGAWPSRARQSAGVAPAVADAARDLHAPPPRDPVALEAAIAAHHGVDPAQVVVGVGTTEIMDHAFRTQTAGSRVIATSPTFELYADLSRRAALDYTPVPWTVGFDHDADALRAAIADDTAVCILDLPHSVSGVPASPDAIRAVASTLPPSALLLLDLVYADYSRIPLPGTADLLRLHPNTLVCRSFSKAHCLLGARVGYAIALEPLAAGLRAERLPYALSTTALAAAHAALDDPDAAVRTVAASHAARDRLTTLLDQLRLPFVATEGNFLLFNLGRHHAAVTERLRDQSFRYRDGQRWGLPGWIQAHLIDEPTLAPLISALAAVDVTR